VPEALGWGGAADREFQVEGHSLGCENLKIGVRPASQRQTGTFAGHFLNANLPSTQSRLSVERTIARPRWGFFMSIGYPPHGDDEFFATLSPLLEEAAQLGADRPPRRQADDLLLLLEENARLRKLAVKLSNLLGDLPAGGDSVGRTSR
jgi:hypothetical protein